jgi:squalene synthase HpnC
MSAFAGGDVDAAVRGGLRDAKSVMDQAASENFSVATRLIPPRHREHLLAIYGFCRLVDDLGDEAPGDRAAALDWATGELADAFDARATHPLFVRLAATIRECSLDEKPFLDLIAANRMDQVKSRYETFEELGAYCELSANPVGRLVLAVFASSTPMTCSLSDDICTALQLIEHLQDVAEDFAAGRVYLPAQDLRRFAVSEADLGVTTTSAALRRLIAFEVSRARQLLLSGKSLVDHLRSGAKVAVSGFVGGGFAQLDAFASASFSVLDRDVKASRLAIVGATLRVYAGSRRV